MRVEIDLPEKYMLDETVEDMSRRLRLSAALLLFQQGRLSAGAACEFAAVDRYAFLEACRRHSIPVIDYDPTHLDDELSSFRETV